MGLNWNLKSLFKKPRLKQLLYKNERTPLGYQTVNTAATVNSSLAVLLAETIVHNIQYLLVSMLHYQTSGPLIIVITAITEYL